MNTSYENPRQYNPSNLLKKKLLTMALTASALYFSGCATNSSVTNPKATNTNYSSSSTGGLPKFTVVGPQNPITGNALPPTISKNIATAADDYQLSPQMNPNIQGYNSKAMAAQPLSTYKPNLVPQTLESLAGTLSANNFENLSYSKSIDYATTPIPNIGQISVYGQEPFHLFSQVYRTRTQNLQKNLLDKKTTDILLRYIIVPYSQITPQVEDALRQIPEKEFTLNDKQKQKFNAGQGIAAAITYAVVAGTSSAIPTGIIIGGVWYGANQIDRFDPRAIISDNITSKPKIDSMSLEGKITYAVNGKNGRDYLVSLPFTNYVAAQNATYKKKMGQFEELERIAKATSFTYSQHQLNLPNNISVDVDCIEVAYNGSKKFPETILLLGATAAGSYLKYHNGKDAATITGGSGKGGPQLNLPPPRTVTPPPQGTVITPPPGG